MKRIFIGLWLCFINYEANGGVLSCQANYIIPGEPWSAIGLNGAYTGFYEASTSFPGLTGEIIVDDVTPSLPKNDIKNSEKGITMFYTVTMSPAASRALAGVPIQGIAFLLNGASQWVINGHSHIIRAGTTQYTGSIINQSNYNGLAIALGHVATDSLQGSMEAASDFYIIAEATYFINSMLYGRSNHYITVNGSMMITDTLSFPDQISLGELEAGALTSAPAITSSVNRNNLSPTFNLITTTGESSVRINDSILMSGVPFTPSQEPYRIGIWLPDDAIPGTHSATVSVNWTCP